MKEEKELFQYKTVGNGVTFISYFLTMIDLEGGPGRTLKGRGEGSGKRSLNVVFLRGDST